jgi:hypothetical protein
MKTKQLLLIATLFAGSVMTTQSQTILLEEEFSSTEWENELVRLNPGADEFGVLINLNATNIVAYTTPPATGGTGAYNNLNKVDLYFNKYRLEGAIEVLEPGLCEDGLTHANPTTGKAVAYRFTNPGGIFELPELTSAGTITIHVKNGNTTNNCNLGLEKYNAETSTWERINLFLVKKRNDLKNEAQEALLDETITFDINSNTPIKLRLINIKYDDGLATRFINMYHIKVTEFEESSVIIPETVGFKQVGRKLIVNEPMTISIYNVIGSLLMEKSVVNSIQIPASLGNGIFMVKTAKGNQKIFLD